MIILLFVTVLLLTIIDYKINKNILIPSLSLLLSFLFSSGIYVLCLKRVGDDISVDTFIIVVISLLLFVLGEILMVGLLNKGRIPLGYKNQFFKFSNNCLNINSIVLFCFCLIILISTYLRIAALCQVANVTIGLLSFLDSYSQIRFYVIHGVSLELPTYIEYISLFAPCIAKISVTILTYNFLTSKKIYWKYFSILGCYMIYLLTTTSRTVYLEFVVYTVIQAIFLRMFILNKEPIINKENIKPVFKGIFIFCLIFFGIGAMAKKNESILNNIFAYTSAGLLGLTKYLEFPYYANSFIESRTLQGLFSPFRIVGLKLPNLQEFLPHYYYTNGTATSNEYTCFMEPIHDFGVLGMLITRILLGIIFYLIFFYIIKECTYKKKYVCIPILGQLYYPLVIGSIDDQFSTYIGMYFLYQVLITIIIWRIFVKYGE